MAIPSISTLGNEGLLVSRVQSPIRDGGIPLQYSKIDAVATPAASPVIDRFQEQVQEQTVAEETQNNVEQNNTGMIGIFLDRFA